MSILSKGKEKSSGTNPCKDNKINAQVTVLRNCYLGVKY
jgi:hypothetical protein